MKTKTFVRLAGLLALASFSSCGDINKKYEEQSAYAARGAVQESNADLAQKAERAEKDLATRQRIYQAIEGKYVAGRDQTFTDSDGIIYTTTIEIVANVPPYHQPRVRTESEISADIASLSVSAHVMHTTMDRVAATAVCTFLSVPFTNLETGLLVLKGSADCQSNYTIYISIPTVDQPIVDHGRIVNSGRVTDSSSRAAHEILGGSAAPVQQLVVMMKSPRFSQTFNYTLDRVSP